MLDLPPGPYSSVQQVNVHMAGRSRCAAAYFQATSSTGSRSYSLCSVQSKSFPQELSEVAPGASIFCVSSRADPEKASEFGVYMGGDPRNTCEQTRRVRQKGKATSREHLLGVGAI